MNQRLKTHTEITKWLEDMGVENYTLNPKDDDGLVVDVGGSVDLAKKKLSFIPVKFNCIAGDFLVYGNQLTTLDFAPVSVGGSFNCSINCLTSLLGAPMSVGVSFNCGHNQIESLLGSPVSVGKDYMCHNNHLTSLRNGPQTMKGSFYCAYNKLENLLFCPQFVGEGFFCGCNPLLGRAQRMRDFSDILEIHQKELIEQEKHDLFHTIRDSKDMAKKTHKI